MNQSLLDCPFCGFAPSLEDADCLYPATRDKSVWSLNCYETGGGCGASVLADSSDGAIAAWNRRQKISIEDALPQFRSGNEIPVERAVVTRKELNSLLGIKE